jgi:hypothetical protein
MKTTFFILAVIFTGLFTIDIVNHSAITLVVSALFFSSAAVTLMLWKQQDSPDEFFVREKQYSSEEISALMS